MSRTITVQGGLQAYFKQPSGQSRPGVDWAVQIDGERAYTVMVRTYFSSDPPQELEKQALAERAVKYLSSKIERGWIPEPGFWEATDDDVS